MCIGEDVGNPDGWSRPVKIMDREEAIYADLKKSGNGRYAELVGVKKGEADKIASETARLFVDGMSRWEIKLIQPEK